MELDPYDILMATWVQKLGPIEMIPTILDLDPRALVIVSSTSLHSMNYLVWIIFTYNPFGIHALHNLYSLHYIKKYSQDIDFIASLCVCERK